MEDCSSNGEGASRTRSSVKKRRRKCVYYWEGRVGRKLCLKFGFIYTYVSVVLLIH